MINYFWIAIGGAIGTIARYWCSGIAAQLVGETFPFGTLFVNVFGSFVIGFVASAGPDSRYLASGTARQFIMVGICGGYTTFSSFSLQTLNLIHDEEWLYAGGNVVLSVVLCMLAVWLGFMAGASLNQLKGA